MYGTSSSCLPESFWWYTGLGEFWPHLVREKLSLWEESRNPSSFSWHSHFTYLSLRPISARSKHEFPRITWTTDTIQQSLFLLCQEDTYFAQKPLGAKESHEDVARLACRAESRSRAALPAPGSRGGTGSFPLFLGPAAVPSYVTSLMLFWLPHHTSGSNLFNHRLQSSQGCSNTHFTSETLTIQSSHSFSISWIVQTWLGSALFPQEERKTSLWEQNNFSLCGLFKNWRIKQDHFLFFGCVKYSSHFCSTALQLPCSSWANR